MALLRVQFCVPFCGGSAAIGAVCNCESFWCQLIELVMQIMPLGKKVYRNCSALNYVLSRQCEAVFGKKDSGRPMNT